MTIRSHVRLLALFALTACASDDDGSTDTDAGGGTDMPMIVAGVCRNAMVGAPCTGTWSCSSGNYDCGTFGGYVVTGYYCDNGHIASRGQSCSGGGGR